jgi:hypothetical protein
MVAEAAKKESVGGGAGTGVETVPLGVVGRAPRPQATPTASTLIATHRVQPGVIMDRTEMT